MKKGLDILIGLLVGVSVLWMSSKGGFETVKSPGDAVPRLEGKTRPRESWAGPLAQIHSILSGRRPLPGKFEELEKLARGLSDLEIRSLLGQRQDAGVEDPWTWVRCALWSIVGERADGLGGMPEKPAAVPDEISGEPFFAAKRRAEYMAMDWGSFLRGFARKQPAIAWSQLMEPPDFRARGGYAGDEILDWVVEEVVANWARMDPEQAHLAILEASDGGRGTTTLAAVAGFHLGVPPDKRSGYFPYLYGFGHHAGFSHSVDMHGVAAGVWARSEPDAALAWLREQLPTDRKLPVKAALGAFLAWWAEDPESLYRWCENADAGSKEVLGDRPVTSLVYRRPRLAAALVEDGWEMQESPDWEQLVSSRQPRSPEDPGNSHTRRAPWLDWNLTDEQWRSDFRQALPVFGVPEAVQKELLGALDRNLMKSTKRDDEEVDR